MKLKIRSFADTGIISKERLILRAMTDLDVGDYAVLRSGKASTDQQPTSGRKSAYWFPDEKIRANDLVILYTKRGSRSAKPMDGGRTAFIFYWGKDEPLWDDDKFGAVLVEVADWQFEVPLLPVGGL